MDECNAAIGLATAHLEASGGANTEEAQAQFECQKPVLIARLQLVQNFLFDLGAHLATPRTKSSSFKVARTEFAESAVQKLEGWIDDMDSKLPQLTTFLLPGGHPASAALHMARTIARRAERAITPLYRTEQEQIEGSAYRFLNRLSDFLFVASRMANCIVAVTDVKWQENRAALNDIADGCCP